MINRSNPPAFPRPAYAGTDDPHTPFPHHEQDGMTLRDYFAAAAPMTLADAERTLKDEGAGFVSYGKIYRRLAQMQLAYADAMLEERLTYRDLPRAESKEGAKP